MSEKSENGNSSGAISRNAPCPCGSGEKYKLCCGAKAVAAEREAAEKKSPFWVPEGITAAEDLAETGWPNGRPKWSMTLKIDMDEEPLNDAKRVVEMLIRPYFERYCRMTDFERGEQFEIAVMECFAYRGNPLDTCPSVLLGRYCQLWDMLLDRLENLLSDCNSDETYCEVRWDHMFGGPIVTLSAGKTSATFCVAKPERFKRSRSGDEEGEATGSHF